MRPTVGQIVHYVSYGTPGGEFSSLCRAAVVTEVGDDGRIGAAVLNPMGIFLHTLAHEGGLVHDPGEAGKPTKLGIRCHGGERIYRAGTWHWPEYAG